MMKIVVAIAPEETDSAALEAALELREAPGGEVVAIALAPPAGRESLLSALAVGADRGVQIVCDRPGELDAIATARALAGPIASEMPDLVLCGAGATGVALGAMLGLPRVAGVSRIDHDAPAATATVERELEGGTVEAIEVRLPAVLTVQPGAYKLRYSSLTAVRLALAKPVVVFTPAHIETATRIRAVMRTPQHGQAQMLDGSPTEIAERIAAVIRSEAI